MPVNKTSSITKLVQCIYGIIYCLPISGASCAQELLLAEGDHLGAAEQPRLQTEEGVGTPAQGQDGDLPGEWVAWQLVMQMLPLTGNIF